MGDLDDEFQRFQAELFEAELQAKTEVQVGSGPRGVLGQAFLCFVFCLFRVAQTGGVPKSGHTSAADLVV